MTYDLAIGDRAYSSWSLRGWLLIDAFGLPVRVRRAQMRTPEFAALLADYAPARTVPAMRAPDGSVATDSLAIAEELASRHPDAGHWPRDPAPRAAARSIAAEMHAAYAALRAACPMNLRTAWRGYAPSPDVLADLARIDALWTGALERSGGPWLFGAYTAADAFHAPVAARVAGYALPVSEGAAAYVARSLTHPSVRRWRAMATCDGPDQAAYDLPYGRAPFPLPPARTGTRTDAAPANGACPYSGRPAAHAMALDGRVWGFCTAACRDRTMADPDAWPAFAAMEGAAAR